MIIVKLLTEHHLEFLSFQGGCGGSSVSDTCQNVTLLETTYHGSIMSLIKRAIISLFPIKLKPTKNLIEGKSQKYAL